MKKNGLLIPIFNEEKTMDSVISQVDALSFLDEVVLIDDGSRDSTPQKIRNWVQSNPKKYKGVFHDRNQGKGLAIATGLEAATADVLAIQDADLEYDPKELEDIFKLVHAGEAQVIFGSRFIKPNPNIYGLYLFGNKFMTIVINLFGRGKLSDSYTCYKVMSRDLWKKLQLNSRGFELEAEISIKCLLNKWKIQETPVSYSPRTFEEGKKIRGKDAIKGINKMLKIWIRSFCSQDGKK